MKRKALVSLSAALPIATLAVGSALAQPPMALADQITSPATAVKQVSSVAKPQVSIHIGFPVTLTLTSKNAGLAALSAPEAAKSLDS